MKLRMRIVALGLLACFGGVPQALAEELAPGITYEVLKEHDASLIPGVTKIIESIFIMQPGTSIDFPNVSCGSPTDHPMVHLESRQSKVERTKPIET